MKSKKDIEKDLKIKTSSEVNDLSGDIAPYLSPRLNLKLIKGALRSDLEDIKDLESDTHKVVYVATKSDSEMLTENDVKRLANAVNEVDKKYRIIGFLLKAASLKLGDKNILISYIALSPSDANDYLKNNNPGG